jgi:hypothetical protein
MFSGTDVRVRKVLVSNEMIRFLQNFAAQCSVCGSSFKFCAFRLPQGGGVRIPYFRRERRDFSHRNGTASGCAHARFCGMPAAFHPPIFAVWPSAMSAGWLEAADFIRRERNRAGRE